MCYAFYIDATESGWSVINITVFEQSDAGSGVMDEPKVKAEYEHFIHKYWKEPIHAIASVRSRSTVPTA
jgi:hypothetical protein